MDIQAFFDLWSGKWVSQRTIHDLRSQQNQSTRADLWIETLDPTTAPIAQICSSNAESPTEVYCGFEIRWTEAADLSSSRQSAKGGSTTLIFFADAASSSQGTFLRQDQDQSVSKGHYGFGEDEVLTMVTQVNDYQFSERFWFASPNLRMRNTIISQGESTHLATFCTEIRLGGTSAATPANQAVAQSNAG
jgi:hypothetical protein